MAKRTKQILERLDEAYGREYVCYLNHDNAWQLLIAVIMSAQCTDARVNLVTKDLFRKYDTLEKFAYAEIEELEQDIPALYEILKRGSEAAREEAAETLADVKRAMRINYFEDAELIRAQSEKYR